MSLKELMLMQMGMRNLLELLTDKSKPPKTRIKILADLFAMHHDNLELLQPLLAPVLDHAAEQHELIEAAQLKTKYDEALQELTQGPLRAATFVRCATSRFGPQKVRAEVVFSDGQRRPAAIAEHVDRDSLKPGATVYLDPKGAVLLDVVEGLPETGHSAKFLRLLPSGTAMELLFRDEILVCSSSYELAEMAASGQLAGGDLVTFCPTRQFAFLKLPARTDRKHRFIDSAKIPEVIPDRDIGSPHWIYSQLRFRLHIMLHRPDLMERFHMRPRFSVIFVGPSGVGKTLTIEAFLYEFYRMIREFTGRNDIGSRVIRVKSATLLSEWLGRSDKNIEELFDDLIWLASQECELAGRTPRASAGRPAAGGS